MGLLFINRLGHKRVLNKDSLNTLTVVQVFGSKITDAFPVKAAETISASQKDNW